jgi:hypothetical protein
MIGSLYKWKNNGVRNVKGQRVTTYNCEDDRCPARTKLYVDIKSPTTKVYVSLIDHNHHPPVNKKRKADPLLVMNAKARMLHGQTPHTAHRELVNQTSSGMYLHILTWHTLVITDSTFPQLPVLGTVVPSIKAMANFKHYEKRSGYVSMNALLNLFSIPGGYVRELTVIPAMFGLMATDFAINILQSSAIIYVDGTFRILECGLILTIIMVPLHGLLIPVVFVMHDNRSTETYDRIFQCIHRLCGGKFEPLAMVSDYEDALRASFRQRWPGGTCIGDSFHFVHAIRRWVREHMGKTLLNDITAWVRMILVSTSFESATANIKAMESRFSETNPSFVNYFRRQWITGLLV